MKRPKLARPTAGYCGPAYLHRHQRREAARGAAAREPSRRALKPRTAPSGDPTVFQNDWTCGPKNPSASDAAPKEPEPEPASDTATRGLSNRGTYVAVPRHV